MQGCILPLFLIICSNTLHIATSAGINPAIDGQCKKVVAFLALQTVTVDGQGASYLGESSSKYQQHLKVALMSMRQNCPSIRPVVVSMYPLQEATKAWIKVLGAEVMIHQLTFSEDVLKLAEEPEYAWVKGVISTYLRTEVWPTYYFVRHFQDILQLVRDRSLYAGPFDYGRIHNGGRRREGI